MRRIGFVLPWVILMTFLRPDIAFTEIYGRADLSYLESETIAAGVTTDSSTFNQVYTLGFDKALTSTLSIGGDVRLTITERDGRKEDSLFPMFYLNFTPPPIFNMAFSYNSTETAPSNADNISSTHLNASFDLPLKDYPSLSIAYNRQTIHDDREPHSIDAVTTNLIFNSMYNFDLFDIGTDFSYTLLLSKQEDKAKSTNRDVPSHLVTANLSKSFLDKKIKTYVNFGYNRVKNKSTSLAGPSRFEQKISATDGLFAPDATPATGSLASTPALINNDTVTSTGIDLNGSFRNMGFMFSISQAIYKMHLYITTADTNIATYNFGWQLYTSSDGINWTFTGTPAVSYEPAFSRFAFTFSETNALYFKIVNTTFPVGALPINVTEIEPIGFILSSPSETLTFITARNFGGFRLSYTPFERLIWTYNINYDHFTQDINDLESLTVNQGSNLNFVVFPRYLNLLTSYTNTRVSSSQEMTAGTLRTKSGSNNYTITLSSTPLPTLNANLNYSYRETSTDGRTSSRNNSAGGDVYMNLYSGVDLNLGSNISKTKNIRSDSRTDSTFYYINVNLIPWRPVNILVDGSINKSTSEAPTDTTTSTVKVLTTTISYTPTRKLFFSGTLNVEPSHSQSYSIAWLPTKNIQTGIRYGFSEDTRNMGANLSWTPIRRLTMNFSFTSTESDDTDTSLDSFFMRASLQI